MITPTRRSLITGLVSLIAAPAIVRASLLMPVKAILTAQEQYNALRSGWVGYWVDYQTGDTTWIEMAADWPSSWPGADWIDLTPKPAALTQP